MEGQLRNGRGWAWCIELTLNLNKKNGSLHDLELLKGFFLSREVGFLVFALVHALVNGNLKVVGRKDCGLVITNKFVHVSSIILFNEKVKKK
jgi:hypothetical protein